MHISCLQQTTHGDDNRGNWKLQQISIEFTDFISIAARELHAMQICKLILIILYLDLIEENNQQ